MIKISKLLFSILILFFIIMPEKILANQKLKIGLLVPLSENNQEIGQLIIKTVRMAINDIDSENIEVIEIGVPAEHTTTIDHILELVVPQFKQKILKQESIEHQH